MIDFGLVVAGAKGAAAVVAQPQADRGAALDGPEAVKGSPRAGGRRRHSDPSRGAASTHASPVQWSTIANTAQRPSRRVQAAVGSVAHSWSGTSVVMRPSAGAGCGG